MRKLTYLLSLLIAVTLSGCNPRVIVEDDWRLRQARISLDRETTGDLADICRTETPTTTVITITFTKKKGN